MVKLAALDKDISEEQSMAAVEVKVLMPRLQSNITLDCWLVKTTWGATRGDRPTQTASVWRNSPEKFLDTNIVVRMAPWWKRGGDKVNMVMSASGRRCPSSSP